MKNLVQLQDNLIEGSVKKLPSSDNQKLPNIGWLNIKISDREEPLIQILKALIPSTTYIHFMLSQEPNILAKTNFLIKPTVLLQKKVTSSFINSSRKVAIRDQDN